MTVDRGGINPISYNKHERTILVLQAKRDRQKIPQVWYWRLLSSDETGGGAPYEEYYEQPIIQRKYTDPFAVHLFVDASGQSKGMQKGYVETSGNAQVELSRAEARRLGAILKTRDDKDYIRDESKESGGPWQPQDYIFIPRPGDVFMYRADHFVIQQINEPETLGLTDIAVVYKGTASQTFNDSTNPVELDPGLTPKTSRPGVSSDEG